MQKSTNQPANLLIQQQSTVSGLPQQVIEFFESRIEAEENYAKALLKLNNKFPNIQSQPTASSKVLKHLKAIHSEKYHQTTQFIVELKQQKQNFQNAISKTNEQLQKSAKQARVHQMNLKNVLQKIGKIYIKGQQQIKSIDEKFLLKQLSLLSVDYKTKNIEDSLRILDEEAKVCEKLKVQYDELKTQGEKLIKKIKKHQKVIFQTSPEIQKEIIQLIKRYTVQQISLIRNLQYDIDGMIKKTNIFDEAPPQQQKGAKPPKNSIVKNAKQLFKDQFKIKDIYQQAKKNIANTTEAGLKSMETKKDLQTKLSQPALQHITKWEQTKKVDELFSKLDENYNQYKQVANQFVEHFRNKNINKFSQKQFVQLQKIFNLLMNKTYDQRDFQTIQKLIIYGSCYSKENPEKGPSQTIMETINKKQFLSDPYFWRFLLFFAVQRSVIQCISIQNEKQIHLKNNVFSTLVSNSLNMIGCGIDKYVTKNTVAKIAKAFGLPDNQVGDLLKFIESGYEKYEKEKGKK